MTKVFKGAAQYLVFVLVVFFPCLFNLILNGPQSRPLFRLFSVFFKQTIQFLQQMNVKNVMSIQYLAPGFKPTTFGT